MVVLLIADCIGFLLSINNKSKIINKADDSPQKLDPCPHHIYGTWEKGFFGAFGMQTKDLTTDESKRIQQNCPNTTWPEQYTNN